MKSLRDTMRAIRKAFNCPVCGKSKMISATAHRGRGTGRKGESHYDATAFEAVSPDTHCTCPGGPVDLQNRAAAQE